MFKRKEAFVGDIEEGKAYKALYGNYIRNLELGKDFGRREVIDWIESNFIRHEATYCDPIISIDAVIWQEKLKEWRVEK